MQRRFLRILQEKTFEPVGGDDSITVNVRVIAATNVNLEEAVTENRFRSDLFYRLKVFRIRIPPLRERREDIPLLAVHFLHKHASRRRITGIAPETMAALVSYDWPGNIRELESVIRAARVYAKSEVIGLEDLPDEVRGPKRSLTPPPTPAKTTRRRRTKSEATWKQIQLSMAKNGNDIPAIARDVGISEGHVYRIIRRHSL